MIRDYFKEQTEYEQVAMEKEVFKLNQEMEELKLELLNIFDESDFIEALYDLNVINIEQLRALRNDFDLEIILKEKTK